MPPAGMTKDDLVTMMNIMDADGSGDVEKEEFEEYYRRLKPEMTDKEFALMWKQIDANGDGCLQFSELCVFFGVNVAEAESAKNEILEMSDEMILDALQLQSILREEQLQREKDEKAKKKANLKRRTVTGVREGVKVVKLSDTSPEAELLQECELGNKQRVQDLIQQGVPLRIQDEKAEMPLHKLAKVGATEQLRLIIDKFSGDEDALYSDLNAPDKQGWTPMFHAVTFVAAEEKKKPDAPSNTSIFTTLLKAGADLDHQSTSGWNVLHVAAHHDSKVSMEELIKFFKTAHPNDTRGLEAFVNQGDVDGRVPLHIASFRASDGVVKFLLDNHAKPEVADSHEHTPLNLAERAGRRKSKEVIEEFIETKKTHTAKYEAARRRSISRDEFPADAGAAA